jgi:hypothetical protein
MTGKGKIDLPDSVIKRHWLSQGNALSWRPVYFLAPDVGGISPLNGSSTFTLRQDREAEGHHPVTLSR